MSNLRDTSHELFLVGCTTLSVTGLGCLPILVNAPKYIKLLIDNNHLLQTMDNSTNHFIYLGSCFALGCLTNHVTTCIGKNMIPIIIPEHILKQYGGDKGIVERGLILSVLIYMLYAAYLSCM